MSKAKDVELILQELKEKKSPYEKVIEIAKLPEDIRIDVMKNCQEIFEMKLADRRKFSWKYGTRFLKKDGIYKEAIVSLIQTLSEKNRLQFLKELPDMTKIEYILRNNESDNLKLELLNIISDKPYQIVIARTINNIKLRREAFSKINASPIISTVLESHNEKKIPTELRQENPKYESIGISNLISFGIEIEVLNRNYAFFLNTLKKLYGWDCKREVSITLNSEMENQVDSGIELSSPILHDDKESVSQIYAIWNILNSFSSEKNDKCGGHIHIGIDYFDNANQIWNVIEIYHHCLDVFNLILNESGTLPRDGISSYAKDGYYELKNNGIKILKDTTVKEFQEQVWKIRGDSNKAYDISFPRDKPTIEFRGANEPNTGKNAPDIWIENVKLIGNLVETGKKLDDKDEKIQNLKAKLLNENQISKKCDLLLELLFDDSKDREIYLNRFKENHKLQVSMHDYKNYYNSRMIKTYNFGRE